MEKIKLIRSSTMKCMINKNVQISKFNTEEKGNILYRREEKEGIIEILDDFSMDKYAVKKGEYKGSARFKSPIMVRWDITYNCNFSCIHCYSSCDYDKKNHLTLDEAKQIVDILDKEKVQFVQILGGEPFIYPHIFELIEYALTKNFIFCINSNGFLLNEKRINRLSQMGLKYIQLSLYGPQPEHEKVTKIQSSFKKSIDNIALLLKNGISVSVSCVISDINKHLIFQFMSDLVEIGIKDIQFLTPLQEGRAKDNLFKLDWIDFVSLKNQLIDFKNNNPNINLDLPGFDVDLIDGMINELSDSKNYEFMFGCIGGVSGFRIDPLGNACICVGCASEPLGNIIDTPMSLIMDNLYEWRIKNVCDMCRDCPSYLNECQGACYLRFKNSLTN